MSRTVTDYSDEITIRNGPKHAEAEFYLRARYMFVTANITSHTQSDNYGMWSKWKKYRANVELTAMIRTQL